MLGGWLKGEKVLCFMVECLCCRRPCHVSDLVVVVVVPGGGGGATAHCKCCPHSAVSVPVRGREVSSLL